MGILWGIMNVIQQSTLHGGAIKVKCKQRTFTIAGDNWWIIPCHHIGNDMKKKKIVQQPSALKLVLKVIELKLFLYISILDSPYE